MALLLRRFAAGRLTNDEFEDALPLHSPDLAIRAIYREGVWSMYSDLSEHRLVGRDRLDGPCRREVAKYILFLKSDHEYRWPEPCVPSLLFWFLTNLFTLGLAGFLYRKWYDRDPDRRTWPFHLTAELAEATAYPPYLAGAA